MKLCKWICYDRDPCGYQIKVIPPTDKYPMYQITCNDPECGYAGVTVRATMEEVETVIANILSHAEDWEEMAV